MDSSLDLLTLSLLPDLGPRHVRALRERAPAAQVVAHPGDFADLLPPPALERLRSPEARREAEAELKQAERSGARLVGLDDPDYPELLAHIYDPPPVLYVRGRLLPGEGARSVALVGSRAASPQGTALTRGMARDLAAAGVTVVSGLARGIDAAAHQGALDAGGRTVAVLGSGLDRLYPPEHAALAAALEQSGALVSEFRLGTTPQPGHFPRRNRVISGWCRAVVVMEAREKSGALITAREALEAGREVMAVPGHPGHPNAAGTNGLIRDGARLVRDARDVAEELGFGPQPGQGAAPPEPDDVLRAVLAEAPRTVDEIQAACGRPLSEVLARLGELELHSRVRRLPGALFLRNNP